MIPDINECINNMHKRVVEILTENARLREQNAKLKEFARYGIREIAWQGADWDGFEIQEAAERWGLIIQEPYDPEKHSPTGLDYDMEPGDPYYNLADWLREDADGRALGREECAE